MAIYITGDKRGSFLDVEMFTIGNATSRRDALIILGDAVFLLRV